jgi:hypothetical protein
MLEKIGVMVIVALAVLGLVRLLRKNVKGEGCPCASINGGKCGSCGCEKGEGSQSD